ncbi:hypothetical protein [Gordonia sp. (in: high G+C Gram-positive bacteria)]|uniref:hypothetical protein n=1 Tax=Gordonia sp. (in: high G+C Gram-positive bacteria) TaxID=84139 RepID=UPI003526E5B6
MPVSGTRTRGPLAALAAVVVAGALVLSACGDSGSARRADPWDGLAAAYPSLAGGDGLVVPSMEPDTSPEATLYQTAYGRAALRNAGRDLPPVAPAKLMWTLGREAATDPIWSGFQVCLASPYTGTAALLSEAGKKLHVDLAALAAASVGARDSDAGYSAQVLACLGPDVLAPHRAAVERIAADPAVTSYQRYLAVQALAGTGTAVPVDGRSLPELPARVDCGDPASASNWMAVHQLHRLADPGFSHPGPLVDCAAGLAGRLNAQSALAAAVVADRRPAELQKLSTPVIDPLAQQMTADGLLVAPPPGGLRWTFSYAAALKRGGARIPAALTAVVADQISAANTAHPDGARNALLAGLCAVDDGLTCPASVVDSGRAWVADIDFADLDVNVYTWMETLDLARVLGITPKSRPSAEAAGAFAGRYSTELKQAPGLIEALITAAAGAGMTDVVRSLAPLTDPRRTFTDGLAGRSLTAAGSAYTAAKALGIDTAGWLDGLPAALKGFAVNDVTGYPYSDTSGSPVANSSASIAAATLSAAANG